MNGEQRGAQILAIISEVCRRNGVRVSFKYDMEPEREGVSPLAAATFDLRWRVKRIERAAGWVIYGASAVQIVTVLAEYALLVKMPIAGGVGLVGVSVGALVVAVMAEKWFRPVQFAALQNEIGREVAIRCGMMPVDVGAGGWAFCRVEDEAP